jgi:hypothetical protein
MGHLWGPLCILLLATEFLHRGWNGRGVKLITHHFRIVPRWRMCGATTQLLLRAFLAWIGTMLPFSTAINSSSSSSSISRSGNNCVLHRCETWSFATGKNTDGRWRV